MSIDAKTPSSRPSSDIVHSCTQGEYRKRNAKDGRNHIWMGQLALVQMYGFWDDCYRQKIAEASGREKNDLKSDIMGDLRWLRQSIVHHRGIALNEVEKCKILNWFREGDTLSFTPEQFEILVRRIKTDLPECVKSL